MFLVGASSFAGMQGAALRDVTAAVRLLLVLGVVYAASRIISTRSRRPVLTDFNEAPATFQRLGLHT